MPAFEFDSIICISDCGLNSFFVSIVIILHKILLPFIKQLSIVVSELLQLASVNSELTVFVYLCVGAAGNECKVPVGVLNVKLELYPPLADHLSIDVIATQVRQRFCMKTLNIGLK